MIFAMVIFYRESPSGARARSNRFLAVRKRL
jgi:hypothetical protein